MKNKLYLLTAVLFGILCSAQALSWQWAKTGGGSNGANSVGFNQRYDEHILDMVVDNQNNAYYLTTIFDGSPVLDGQAVTHYGDYDILLFSTDCMGNVRWSRSIGGGGGAGEFAQKIVLDNNGGVYLTFGASNASSGGQYLPIRFGDNDVLPVVTNFNIPQAALRYGYLLKYSATDGSLVWRRDFQGDVSIQNSTMDLSGAFIDTQNNIHVIVGFLNGTHLNGMVTVPASYTSVMNFQYYLVKYDTAGNIVGTPALLPLEGTTTFRSGYLNFIFDEANSRYYIAGSRNLPGGGANTFIYNSIPINQNAFLLAIDSQDLTEDWRREIYNGTITEGDYFFGLKKDPSSNSIFLSGSFARSINPGTVSTFSNHTFTTSVGGQISFVMKVNNLGNVEWCSNTTSLSDGSLITFMQNARMPIALRGNEVVFAKGSIREVWGTYPMVRPPNDGTDPLVVRLNKDTGAVIGTHEVLGNYGPHDQFTAIATDMDGNIMLGGFINQQLFVDPADGVPTISNVPGNSKTNFFFAKLATSANCSQMSTDEVSDTKPNITFYPNPADDVLHFETEDAAESFEIFAMSGQKVMAGKLKSGEQNINIARLATGTYMVKIKTETGEATGKVIKK